MSANEVVTFQFNVAGQIQPNAPAIAAQLYSNLELNPQNTSGLGTYYLVTFYDQSGARLNSRPMWWQFSEAAGSTVDISTMTPFSTVGGNVIFYPLFGLIPGGPDTAIQSNSGGALYGDLNLTYNKSAGSVGGQYGVFVNPAVPSGSFILTATVVGTPGVGFYSYTVVARRGIAEIAIGLATVSTGNAVLSAGNYNALMWLAVPGATSYDVYSSGFLTNTVSLAYNDIGTAPANTAIPVFAENGFLCVSNGLLVQNSNYQTLQSHFGDSIGNLPPLLGTVDFDGPLARNQFVTAGPGRLVDTVNMPVVGIYASNGPNFGLSVVNAIATTVGTSGAFISAINAQLNLAGVTSTLDGGRGVIVNVAAESCNITGFSADYDHGCVIGGIFISQAFPFNVNSHVDCVVGLVGTGLLSSSAGSSTMSVTHLIGVAGGTDFGQGASGSPAVVTNVYQFKAGANDAGAAGTPVTVTNFYNYFADVTGEQSATITNMYGFYSKNLTHPSGPVNTLQAAFYAADQGNNAGAWAYFSAGTTPSSFGGDVAAGSLTTGASQQKTLKLNVTSAQLKALPGTPLLLIAAPGANKLIVIQRTTLQYRFVTTAYTLGNADNVFQLVYAGNTTNVVAGLSCSGLVNQVANRILWTTSGALTAVAQTAGVNLAVNLSLGGTAPGLTLGDGTLEMVVDYDIVDLS